MTQQESDEILANLRARIAAGGPGSGPHPGLHSTLTNAGFNHSSSQKGYKFGGFKLQQTLEKYTHPSGSRAYTHSSGKWAVRDSNNNTTHGQGQEELKNTIG